MVCLCTKSLQSCPTLRPFGLQPARLLCPWDFPGKRTGVDCHAFLQGNLPDPAFHPHLLHILYQQAGSLPPGFPGGSVVKASASNVEDLGSIPGLGRFPWRRKWQPTAVFLPGKPHGQRSLAGYSPKGLKKSNMTKVPQQAHVQCRIKEE